MMIPLSIFPRQILMINRFFHLAFFLLIVIN